MVIHCVDFACNQGAPEAFVGGGNSHISNWLSNFNRWQQQQNDPPHLSDTGAETAVLTYWKGGPWRFEWQHDKSAILNGIEGQAQAQCDWYRLRWHECDHQDSSNDGCGWTDVRTEGAIPVGI